MSDIEVKSFKLSSGDEIITRVITGESGDGYITVDRPNMLGLAPSPDGKGIAVQLMPWLASDQEGKGKLYLSAIVAEIVPNKELEAGYLQRTSLIAMAL